MIYYHELKECTEMMFLVILYSICFLMLLALTCYECIDVDDASQCTTVKTCAKDQVKTV